MEASQAPLRIDDGGEVVLVPAGPYSASPQETMLEKVAALDLVLDGSNWTF